MVDGRFVLKVTDYGFNEIINSENIIMEDTKPEGMHYEYASEDLNHENHEPIFISLLRFLDHMPQNFTFIISVLGSKHYKIAKIFKQYPYFAISHNVSSCCI